MKIISWNLKNIGPAKLTRDFAASYSAFGLGGNVLNYITKVVTGDPAWSNLESTKPADIFVVVELKTGGKTKGDPGNSSCLVVLPTLVNALNSVVAARQDVSNDYLYRSVTPLVTGFHETIGIIYNSKSLTLKSSGILPDLTTNAEFIPRVPFGAQFELVAQAGTSIYVAGIHSPPPEGNSRLKYRKPINYNRLLANVAYAGTTNAFFAGDFNCNPASSYMSDTGAAVFPFSNIPTFITRLPNGTLSSVRQKLNTAKPAPASYLSDSFDNIICNYALPATATEVVPDLIGNARNMNAAGTPGVFAANQETVFTAYSKNVSDHLPIITEFTI